MVDDLKNQLGSAVDEMMSVRRDTKPLRDFLDSMAKQYKGDEHPHPFDVWQEVAGRISNIDPLDVSTRMRFAVKHACWMLIIKQEHPTPSDTASKELLPEDVIWELLQVL